MPDEIERLHEADAAIGNEGSEGGVPTLVMCRRSHHRALRRGVRIGADAATGCDTRLRSADLAAPISVYRFAPNDATLSRGSALTVPQNFAHSPIRRRRFSKRSPRR